MIERISSTLTSFKTLSFRPGLNILLAEKTLGATDRQTRNSSGKSSFVEIVHFLLGGSCKTDSIFRAEELKEHAFAMQFDLGNQRSSVERSGSRHSQIKIDPGDTSEWPHQPKVDKKTGELCLSNDEWKDVLLQVVFNFPNTDVVPSPTFRSLFPYFARRANDGGFADPQQHFARQAIGNQQIALSFLFGLDWTIPSELQQVRDKKKSLETVKREAGRGVLGSLIGNAAELKSKLTVAENRVHKLEVEIKAFKVLEEYHELEQEASVLASEISDLANANTIDEESVGELKKAIDAEKPPGAEDVSTLYNEAGVALPGVTLQRLEDVQAFHEAIIKNRISHLHDEISAAEHRLTNRREEMRNRDHRRRQIMEVLNSHGALDQLINIQSELTRLQGEASELARRHELAERLETDNTELALERLTLHKRLQRDHREHEELVEEAILLFEELSSTLCEREGSLTISATENGPVFDVHVEAGRGKGIKNMQIFCFDLMLTILNRRRGIGPGFLIHDSHLFDGMDSRQIAKAIILGAEHAAGSDFQYIVTMNSDALPVSEFPESFDVQPFINPVVLTDATENGGLFGIRFG